MSATSSPTLQQLIQGCAAGQRNSQQKLYERFYAYGMSVSLRYTENEQEATEVLNDSFMKVFRKIDTYVVEKPFHTWFRRILINTAINHYHRQRKHYHHQPIEDLQGVATDEPNVLSQLSYQDIIAVIQQLSPAYKAVFNLHVIDGYTHEEIAQALGISVGTSKSNLSRARVHLKVMLKKSLTAAYKI